MKLRYFRLLVVGLLISFFVFSIPVSAISFKLEELEKNTCKTFQVICEIGGEKSFTDGLCLGRIEGIARWENIRVSQYKDKDRLCYPAGTSVLDMRRVYLNFMRIMKGKFDDYPAELCFMTAINIEFPCKK